MTSVRIEPHLLPDEYSALRNGAGLVDRSARARWRVSGARAAETLTGLVTNDVVALTPGQGQYAAVLTPKGKIIADVRILRFADSVLVDVPALAAAGFADVVKKYLNPRVTPYVDETSATCAVGVYGAQAARTVGAAAGIPQETLVQLHAYAHVDSDLGVIVRVPLGLEIIAGVETREALVRRLSGAGATVCSAATWDIVRVEAGIPEWGIDIDEATIPQEANLDEMDAISYTKGCYTGQETVARIHFRGHVNRNLRGLRFAGAAALPAERAALFDAAGKAVGDVRTVVRSPRLGVIALAMVRREVAPESTVSARWIAGETDRDAVASVVAVPFPDAW
jgi:tRNA-modifying protein YgfZ